mmetsp:Transcript_27496/g.55324  ORF Transcript_27496/g.55324 Transcript_27496/m.55324 type:complete len:105 (-) Transcript_27496:983-1297(-)
MTITRKKFFTKGIVLGYKRSLRNQKTSRVILKISTSKQYKKLEPFLGKKVFFVKELQLKKKKIIWGKITSFHGRSGAFLAHFKKNLPSSYFGSSVYIAPFPFRN